MVNSSTSMQSHGDSGLDLEAQLARKEREWKELQAVRVNQLESSLKNALEECSSLRERYQQLKEDFQFNLALLDERDRELEKYDIITARALAAEDKRQRELNQLNAHITKLEHELARDSEERQREKSESQLAAVQHSLQMHELKRSMTGEIQKRREEFEMVKLDLRCKIQELEGELTLQRQEMTATFDRKLRQREQEMTLKRDEMCALVMSLNLKIKLLSTENEVHCQAQVQATETCKASEEFCQQLQAQLQHKDQEIKDITAAKEHRIKVLKDDVKHKETKLKKMKEDNMKKYESLVQAVKECDGQLEAQCQAHKEKLQEADKRIAKLQERMKVLAAQVRGIQEKQRVALEQKDKTIQRLCTDVETTRTGWEKYVSHVSSEMVAKDNEMIALQGRESRARTELERSREEMERYKQQLCDGLKRENALEQKKVQMDLEWQRHCEEIKAKIYLANEKLIQELTQARDQAKAELMEKEQQLQDMTVLLQYVKSERNQAERGLTPTLDSLASKQICRMQEQNSILRAVVAQMRKDMEHLSHPTLPSQAQPQVSSAQPVLHPYLLSVTSITSAAKAQMVTEPPSQTSDIAYVSQAGSCAKTSLMAKQQCKVAPTEAAVTNIMGKNALVQQLQEENLFLRQQLPSGLVEDVSRTKSNHPILHKKLKQAASCIARLSREKQQLIEIGNRLRAQISTAGQQEPLEPEKGTSTEKQQEQHDRLSALEQLQYQLTTQELQYAVSQMVHTDAKQLFPVTENHSPTTNGTANPWSHSHKTTDRSESCKNKAISPSLSQSQSSQNVGPEPHSNLFSSMESLQSLQKLWATLDHDKSPSTFSEGNSERSVRAVAEPGGAEGQMAVHGMSAPIHNHSQTEVQQRMNAVKTPSNTTKARRPGASGKIRNYSVKE